MNKNEIIITPICDFLRDYAASGISRFHMPGHKGTDPEDRDQTADDTMSADRSEIYAAFYAHDITEINGADSLYEASGIIHKSEENAAFLFGTAATYYSTEGSSQCIRAMLALATDFGKKPVILAARNVHRAFISAAALLDLDVRWLIPEDGSYSRCSCPIKAQQVREALSRMEVLPAAVYLTSPDYLGNLADITALADAVHAFGIPLLVDNAHGAYLHFLKVPSHPMDLGADMCCDSAHKTLPALTGCAYLHISRRYAERSLVRRALSLFGSSSPSYLLLESLDRTNKILAGSFREQLAECVAMTDRCKTALSQMGWHITGDPLKITIEASLLGLSGHELAAMLRAQQIECEYADPDYAVLMVTPYNTWEDLDRLTAVMKTIAGQSPRADVLPAPELQRKRERLTFSLPEKVLSIREAAFAESLSIPVNGSAGRICADLAISCPPAVPIVVCGERISEEVEAVFSYYGITHIDVIAEPEDDRCDN